MTWPLFELLLQAMEWFLLSANNRQEAIMNVVSIVSSEATTIA